MLGFHTQENSLRRAYQDPDSSEFRNPRSTKLRSEIVEFGEVQIYGFIYGKYLISDRFNGFLGSPLARVRKYEQQCPKLRRNL